MKSFQLYYRSRLPEFLAFAGSLLLSILAISIDRVLNDDGILYVVAADTWIAEGLAASLKIYPWPGFSMLMGAISELTGMSTESAGVLICTLAYAGVCTTFVAICRHLSFSRHTPWLALLVILFLPPLNDGRSDLTRDPAFWFLSLLSFLCVLTYARHPRILHLLAATGLALLAAVFRLEAVFLVAVIPLCVLVLPGLNLRTKVKDLLLVSSVAGSLLVMAYLVSRFHYQITDYGRLFELASWYQYLQQDLVNHLQGLADKLGTNLLTAYTRSYAIELVFILSFSLVLLKLFKVVTPVWSLWLLYQGWRGAPLIPSGQHRLLQLFLAFSIIPVFLFVLRNHIVTDRYVSLTALLLLCWIPLLLGRWLFGEGRTLGKGKLFLAAFIALIYLVKSFTVLPGGRPEYRQAGEWLAEEMAASDTLWANKMQIHYYAGHLDIKLRDQGGWHFWRQWLDEKKWRGYDYAAVVIKPEDELTTRQVDQIFGRQAIHQIKGERDLLVLFYRLKN